MFAFAAMLVLGLAAFVCSEDAAAKSSKFFLMVEKTTSVDVGELNEHGNFCSQTGYGDPVDSIDDCCRKHQECYDRLYYNECRPKISINLKSVPYRFRISEGKIECLSSANDSAAGVSPSCQASVCKCDRDAAICVGKFRNKFQSRRKDPKSIWQWLANTYNWMFGHLLSIPILG